jgi:hypothetical protein
MGLILVVLPPPDPVLRLPHQDETVHRRQGEASIGYGHALGRC